MAVILSAVMSAVVVFLATGVVALIVRQFRRRQQSKQLGRAVNISQVSAAGFETVRSRCSIGQHTEADGAAQPSQ